MNDKKNLKPAGKTSKGIPVISPEKMIEEISKRTYEIHRIRGSARSSDRDDWLEAEREIKASYRIAW
jgi:hypothetical protein